MVFASMPQGSSPFLFILDDEEEAGYFYHDLTQMMGQERVLFFPCSYKRAIKYGQRDAANEILRTEVLTKISSQFKIKNSKSDKNSHVNLSVSDERLAVSGNSQCSMFNVQCSISFTTHPQPVFHKNFELLFQSFRQYMEDGYQLYILADSQKQTDRLESIFEEQATGIHFTPIDKTIHGGFVDDDLKACFFTDHQIFDRYHKYNLRTQQTRTGKVALTLKELQQFEIGDYVVHLDHGVGRFGGLVRIPNGDKMQEVIKIIYNHDDVVFVSIHALHKVSK